MRQSSSTMSMQVGEFEAKAVDFYVSHFAILVLDIKHNGDLVGDLTLYLENMTEANLLKDAFDAIRALRREADEKKEPAE